MPLLYRRAMELRHAGGQPGPLRCAWFAGDCGRLLAWNRAAEQAAGEYLLFMEPYVEPASPNWLDELAACGSAPATGAVGALVTAAGAGRCLGGRLENGELVFNLLAGGEKPPGNAPARCLPSACLLLRREIFLREGGFNINYAPGHYADADLCLRLERRGLKNLACTGAQVIWGKGSKGGPAAEAFRQSPAGLIGRRLFWDVWSQAPFDLESLIRGGEWSKRPAGLAKLWPSEGRMPPVLNFPLPEKFR
jgi:GT2 family glycosyltransferase